MGEPLGLELEYKIVRFTESSRGRAVTIINWPRSYIDVALRSQPKLLAVWRPRKRCPTPRSTVFLIHDPHLDIRSRGQTPT